ncbi:MAG: hypothetical protein Q4F39_02890 [Bacteroidia bacterium]|nr:hypothetical protein [Bacteroidia bacterium]
MKPCWRIIVLLSAVLAAACSPSIPVALEKGGAPSMEPDYSGVTVPANIAPLNFFICDDADAYVTVIGESLVLKGREVRIPPAKWRALLDDNRGGSIPVAVYERHGKIWTATDPYNIYVDDSEIDRYLTYRLIEPTYAMAGTMGIYQRDLTSFRERELYNNTLDRDRSGGQCVNCHSFQNYDAGNFQLHIRQKDGGTVIVRNGKIAKVNLKRDGFLSAGVYPAWHPTEPIIAYSMNVTRQQFPVGAHQKTEVFDSASDLVLYDVEADSLTVVSARPDLLETFPCWSPDGKSLYYSAAVADSAAGYENSRYDIFRAEFDPGTRTFGPAELVVGAAAAGCSALFPRVSPSGKFLMYTMTANGTFPIWHKDSDLYIMEIAAGKSFPLSGANSPDTESYHSWSSSGRWVVFSSRRDDGLYTRFYFAKIEDDGTSAKPFVLPQKDPLFGVKSFKSFNIPEFSKNATTSGPKAFLKAVK